MAGGTCHKMCVRILSLQRRDAPPEAITGSMELVIVSKASTCVCVG